MLLTRNKEVLDSEGNLGIKEIIYQLVRIKFVLDQKEESILLHIKNIFGVAMYKKPRILEYLDIILDHLSLIP